MQVDNGERIRSFLAETNGFGFPPQAFSTRGTLGWGFLSIAAMLVTIVVYIAIYAIKHGVGAIEGDLYSYATAAQLLSYATSVPIALWGIRRLAGGSLRNAGFGPISLHLLGIGAVVTAFAMLVFSDGTGAIVDRFVGVHEEQVMVMLHHLHGPGMIAAFLFMGVVAAPFSEEVFFRGLLFNAFYTRLPLWVAATISGIVFGLAHMDLFNALPLAVAGIVLALAYARYRNIWVNVLGHALFNAVAFLAVFLVR